jgi:prepilin-type N-terminal cleavage/methylation domain-containing protein
MSQLMKRVAKKGFTLIELMIVVAIIGILAAIAIPKFADLITKSKESSAKGSLGSLRGALTIYYSDSEGIWPNNGAADSLSDLIPRYIERIPAISIPAHSGFVGGHVTPVATVSGTQGNGSGWFYNRLNGDSNINCTDEDTKGNVWSSY